MRYKGMIRQITYSDECRIEEEDNTYEHEEKAETYQSNPDLLIIINWHNEAVSEYEQKVD